MYMNIEIYAQNDGNQLPVAVDVHGCSWMIMDWGQDHALSGLAPYHINCCFRDNYLRGTQKLRRQAQAVFVFVYICGYNVHVYHIYV